LRQAFELLSGASFGEALRAHLVPRNDEAGRRCHRRRHVRPHLLAAPPLGDARLHRPRQPARRHAARGRGGRRGDRGTARRALPRQSDCTDR
jgi:hypothetical protein